MSKTLVRIALALLIANAGFWIGRASLSGTLQQGKTDTLTAKAQVQDLLTELDTLNINMAAREGYITEAEALWAKQQDVLEQNLAHAGEKLAETIAAAERDQITANQEIDTLKKQIEAMENARQSGVSESKFRFQWDEFPEFQPVLQPVSLEEYLSQHWTDTAYGDPNAPVKIVEFFSYACPYCKAFHEGAYQQLLNDYMDKGLVQVIKRDFLLNNQSIGFELMAGAGAQCLTDPYLSQRFADLVFSGQQNLAQAQDPAEALLPIFISLGLVEEQARACMRNHRNMSLVFGRSARAIQTAEVSGTPTLFINGEKFVGNPNDYAALAAKIDQELGRVLALR